MKKTKVVSKVELPITIDLKVAGQDKTIKTDSILSVLRNLDLEPLKIKSRATFEVSYKNDVYRKILNITQVKRLLVNKTYQEILAKNISVALGLTY